MRSTTDPWRGTHVTLVPAALADLRHLYEIATSAANAAGWPTYGRTPSLADFAAAVRSELSFALVAPATGDAAGIVALLNLDERAAVAELALLVDPRLPAAGLLAAEALDLCLHHAFGPAGLAKVTVAAPPGPAAQLARLASQTPALTHEGTRRRHRRIGAELVDLELYAWWAPPRRPTASEAEPGDLVALVAALAPTRPETVRRTDRLVEDLGYDSLALLQLVDALDARRDPEDPWCFDGLAAPLTVADLDAN